MVIRDAPIGQVFIELTNVCDFNCAFCPNEVMKRDRGFMDSVLARKIIDEIVETGISKRATFHLMGEPLLHPNAIEIFRYARSKGLEVAFNTNCSRFRRESLLNDLFESDITYIVFSLQTPTRKTYDLRRASMDFETYLSLVKRGIRKKFEKGSRTEIAIDLMHTGNASLIDLREDLMMNVSPQEAHDFLSDFADYANDLADEFSLPVHRNDVQDLVRQYEKGELDREILPGVRVSSRKVTNWANTLSDGQKVIPALLGACDGLIDQFGILWNGDCVFCCVDFDGRTAFGNLSESTLQDIWTDPATIRVRQGFKNLRLEHPFCRVCRGGTTAWSWLVRQIGSILHYKLGVKY